MNRYLAWNTALGEHFFGLQQGSKYVTLYLDQKLVAAIGMKHGLGGWQSFLEAASTKVPTTYLLPMFREPHPLLIADHLYQLWRMRKGNLDQIPVDRLPFPPILVGIAILVLAWTESRLPQERSYYDRLDDFLGTNFPQLVEQDSLQNQAIARKLADALPLLKGWLSMIYGQKRGTLLLGKLGGHRWVGAIRYHALIDPSEREKLPQIWQELGLRPHQTIVPDRLLELTMQVPKLHTKLPALHVTIQQMQLEKRQLIGELLHALFETWNGELPSVNAIDPIVRAKPRLRICMDEMEPQWICLETSDRIDFVWSLGKKLNVVRLPNSTISVLAHADTGEPIVPDALWLFEEIVLRYDGGTIKRAARDHFWLWPGASLGFGVRGFVESVDFLEGAAFRLLARGASIAVAETWMHTLHACQNARRTMIDGRVMVMRGSYPKWNPFRPPKIIPPKPSLLVSPKNRISDSTYRSEFPLKVDIVGDTGVLKLRVEAVSDGQIPLDVSEHGASSFLLKARLAGACGAYQISLWSSAEELLDDEVVHLRWTEPIQHPHVEKLVGFNAFGAWEEAPADIKSTLYLHNRFVGEVPQLPAIAGQPLLTLQSRILEDRDLPDLGAWLVAAARRDGSLHIDTFKTLVREIAAIRGKSSPSDAEIQEIRRNMTALGFCHYEFRSRQIQLSPLTICYLPDDRLSLCALMLGPIAHSVFAFLKRWSAQGDTGLQFAWRNSALDLVPPLLEIRCAGVHQMQGLVNALRQNFPNCVMPPMPQSVSETLLAWLEPIPDVTQMPVSKQVRWTSFPAHDQRWDVKACGFKFSTEEPRFPVLTRNTSGYTGQWDCKWWIDAKTGFEVNHHAAIPKLHALNGIPYLLQNAAKTDEILVAGRHRQSDLLERALVLATGNLPTFLEAGRIVELHGLVDPTATFRLFSGLRPPMRAQLMRIFHPTLNLNPSSNFPQVNIL